MELSESIQRRTESAGKDYGFAEEGNPSRPAQSWYQNTIDGLALFVVFYTQACRWSQCLGCNLPSKMSRFHIPFDQLMRQVDEVFDRVIAPEKQGDLHKIILSNNGSILDEDTFSTTALVYFIARMNMHCRRVSILSLETRVEYVDMEELEILARVLDEGERPTQLELAIGFEAFDPYVRNDVFLKGLSLERFEQLVEDVARHGFKLKTYFMLKPIPGMSEQRACDDILAGIDYLSDLAWRHGVEINMHLNPTYAASGTPLATAFREGRFVPPRLESVREILLARQDSALTFYIGLYDEGMAVPGGSFIREGDEELVARLDAFNASQDFGLLE